MSFALHYAGALLVVALCLFGLHAAMGAVLRRRRTPGNRRFIVVLESTMLAQHTGLLLIKAGSRYVVLGAGSGGVRALFEPDADDVARWLSDQK